MTNIGASNGLIRYYLPKGTDLAGIPKTSSTRSSTSHHPARRVLGYATPAEALNDLLVSELD